MRGIPILIVFFAMITVASLLVPLPMFPGNALCDLIGSGVSTYAVYLSAVVNGLFYGVISWLIFVGISRKLGEK
jgi:hypothetical protein